MKLPVINDTHTIAYDVPYRYMEEDNDCWEATLGMLYEFVGANLVLDDSFNEARANGLKPENLGKLLPKYLRPHTLAPYGEYGYHAFLERHGPALVVLSESKDILHAQVLVGISRSEVLLNNPDRNFLTSDLSASGPFLQIERSFIGRYGGQSFDDWRKAQSGNNNNNSGPLVASHMSPQLSPVHSPPASQMASPVVLRHATSPDASVSPPSSPGEQSPFHTPPASPPRSRRGSLDNAKSPTISSNASPSPPASPNRPSLPDVALSQLHIELTRKLAQTGSDERRRYIKAMEDQLLFRRHRRMKLTEFQRRLLNEEELAPLWTLRGG